MPGFDRTGPRGEGPMTGGGFGPCGGNRVRQGGGGGIGAGRGGRPWGGGRGRCFGGGRGRGGGRGWGWGRWDAPVSVDEERNDLQRYIDTLEEEMASMKRRLQDLTGAGNTQESSRDD